MNDINSCTYFQDCKTTLKETSKDDSDISNIKYMVDSEIEVVDFDKVKQVYTKQLSISEEAICSVDGIARIDQNILFVEFKNGKVQNRNIKDKIRDSVILFNDILETTITYMRNNCVFILVYNEEKNPLPNQCTRGVAISRGKITKKLLQLGNQELVLFDLKKYEKIFFKEVHTYTIDEFEDIIERINEI